jgi:hypothetical protein
VFGVLLRLGFCFLTELQIRYTKIKTKAKLNIAGTPNENPHSPFVFAWHLYEMSKPISKLRMIEIIVFNIVGFRFMSVIIFQSY